MLLVFQIKQYKIKEEKNVKNKISFRASIEQGRR